MPDISDPARELYLLCARLKEIRDSSDKKKSLAAMWEDFFGVEQRSSTFFSLLGILRGRFEIVASAVSSSDASQEIKVEAQKRIDEIQVILDPTRLHNSWEDVKAKALHEAAMSVLMLSSSVIGDRFKFNIPNPNDIEKIQTGIRHAIDALSDDVDLVTHTLLELLKSVLTCLERLDIYGNYALADKLISLFVMVEHQITQPKEAPKRRRTALEKLKQTVVLAISCVIAAPPAYQAASVSLSAGLTANIEAYNQGVLALKYFGIIDDDVRMIPYAPTRGNATKAEE